MISDLLFEMMVDCETDDMVSCETDEISHLPSTISFKLERLVCDQISTKRKEEEMRF